MNPIETYANRAFQLMNLQRFDEAIVELKKALAEEPNFPFGLALLSVCKIKIKQYDEALDLAKHAVAGDPEHPFHFLVLAQAHFYNNNIAEARLAIRQGQQLSPNDAEFFLLKAEIEFHQEKWNQALSETEKGLEHDPENVELINLRSRALVKLNRKAEAEETVNFALNKAPENSFSHANKGWVAIERNRFDDAVKHFLESLRHNPDNEYARHGLKEAIKGKNILYRGMLKYFLWMEKLQQKNRWFFIIGIYVLYSILRRVAAASPEWAPFLYPFIGLYIVFAFSSWIATPLSNLFLRLHPIGKNALDEDEKLGANIVGALIAIALTGLVSYWATAQELPVAIALIAGGMLIPVSGVFALPVGSKPRRSLMIYASIIAMAGMSWLVLPGFGLGILIFALGIFFFGFVANYLIGQANKTL